MSRTAPNSAFDRDELKEVMRGFAWGWVKLGTWKIEMVPYCVPTARNSPVLEKQAAKLPLVSVSDGQTQDAFQEVDAPIV
jgi:hypothetical protein